MKASPQHDLTLLSMFELLYLRDNPKCGKGAIAKYRNTIRYFRWFLSHEPQLSDLDPAKMPEFYRFCFRRGLAIVTVRQHRGRLAILLRYAAQAKLVDSCPELPTVIGKPQRLEVIADRSIPAANTLWHFFEHTVWPTRLSKFKESTRKDYERAIREFLLFCGSSDIGLDQLTEARINDFRKHLQAREPAANSKGKGQGVAYEHWMRLRCIMRAMNPEKFPKHGGHNVPREPEGGPGGLRKFLATYLAERDTSKGHQDLMRWVVDDFAKWLHREPELSDLNKDTINAWLDSMIARELSRVTIQGRRTMLLTLWRHAFECELLETFPRRIKKIKVPRILPKAWTHDQVNNLLVKAMAVPGNFRSGVSRSAYWVAFIRLGYDSGLRLVDIMALNRADIVQTADGFGVLTIVQHKTGVPLSCKLYPETMKAIAEICRPDKERVFWGLSRSCILKLFRKVVRSAGLAGGSKMLRKSGATSVHNLQPGAAMGYLGHLTPGLGFKHYIDLAQTAGNKPMPQRLVDAPEQHPIPPALSYVPESTIAGGAI